jgi:NNP family nitrate/nitrite transporter-like MFS transporter
VPLQEENVAVVEEDVNVDVEKEDNGEKETDIVFDLPVDPEEDYKATSLKICSLARPHMRAFHYSWWSFFIAFFIWFSIAPLLPEVRKTLELTKNQIWITNIVAVSGDIFMRFVFGAVTDKYGARIPMGMVLMAAVRYY